MAAIRPFRALRPARDAAAAVSSVPYDVVSTDEARELAAGNPLSFLHVTRSEIDLPPGHRSVLRRGLREGARHSSRRCAPARRWWSKRSRRSISTGCGWAARADRHRRAASRSTSTSRTSSRSTSGRGRDKEDDRTRHIIELAGADRRGVPDLSRRPQAIDRLRRAVTAGAPLYDFTRRRRRAPHDLAGRAAEEATALVDAFARRARRCTLPTATTAPRARRAPGPRRRRRAARPTPSSPWRFPTTRCRSCPTTAPSRIWPGRRPRSSWPRCAQRVPVRDGGRRRRAARARCAMYLDGQWYTLDLSGAAPADGSRASALDVALPAAPRARAAARHRRRAHRQAHRLRRRRPRHRPRSRAPVDSGKAAVAFSMFPVTVDDLMAISDDGRHHAAQVDLVRAEAAGRAADAHDLSDRSATASGHSDSSDPCRTSDCVTVG